MASGQPLLSVGIYSYKGPDRLPCVLRSIRVLDAKIAIVVAEDRSDDGNAFAYQRICGEFDARHVRLEQWGHMAGANHRAVMECTTPYVLVLSDDVLLPRGLIPAIERFFSSNAHQPVEFMRRLAAVMLHHWDRSDIISMAERGVVPELAGFQEKDFWAGMSEWFWKHLDGRLPYGGWSEPTPPDKVGIVPTVHGSGYIVSREWFARVGGTENIFCWQNDSTLSARINNFSDAMIVRLPWLPSLPHFGGASAVASDPENRWTDSVMALAREHGYAYGGMPNLFYENGEAVAPIAILELGWRARAMALNRRFAAIMDSLDYSYRSECE